MCSAVISLDGFPILTRFLSCPLVSSVMYVAFTSLILKLMSAVPAPAPGSTWAMLFGVLIRNPASLSCPRAVLSPVPKKCSVSTGFVLYRWYKLFYCLKLGETFKKVFFEDVFGRTRPGD